MRLNQVTLTAADLDVAWAFYRRLGLEPIVDSRPHYVRFLCPEGDSTLSVAQGDASGGGTTIYFEIDDLDARVDALTALGVVFDSGPTDERWLWREASLTDPAGNRIILYRAGVNRIHPPWRVTRSDAVD
jgi:catechol 2,3-dioxygenase-like lactoylglutathione lyase family enzyme